MKLKHKSLNPTPKKADKFLTELLSKTRKYVPISALLMPTSISLKSINLTQVGKDTGESVAAVLAMSTNTKTIYKNSTIQSSGIIVSPTLAACYQFSVGAVL